jgi:hypothetical protein
MTTLIGYLLEILVIIIFTSKLSVLDVVLAYTSFYPIVNAPVYYYDDLFNHKIKRVKGLALRFTKFRVDNPLKGADCSIKILRFIYKVCRTIHTSFTYYFMPFSVILMNVKFMIADKSCNPFFPATCKK